MYGGEQVNMCFRYDSNIGKKLKQIGAPLVVRCSLNPNQVNTFIENPWGKIVVSSYHLSQNSEAYQIDQDGYLTVPVGPKKIIEIQTLSDQGILDN